MTKRLILTNDSSAAGQLGLVHRGALVIPLQRELVWGRPPSDLELAVFFGRRKRQTKLHWLDYSPQWRLERDDALGVGLVELCMRAEAIELWIGPRPNDQMQLICLLHFLGQHREIAAKLSLVQAYVGIGGQPPEVQAKWKPPLVKVTEHHFELASRAWCAFGAATPQAWFGLLATDLSPLPRLRNTVIQLLEELPWRATGLGATEMRLLESVSRGRLSVRDVFVRETNDSRRVFDYWEMGALLDGLAGCRTPAVSGLKEGPFTMELHDDRARLRRYNNSKLSLSPLGQAILAHIDDFTRHNPIRRWWGGTKLINKDLWRWDQDNHVLVAP